MWPFNRQRSPQARTHAPEVSGPRQIPTHLRSASALKRRPTASHPYEVGPARGMWVRYQDRTGILTDLEPDDIATVMLVDQDDGTNTLEVHVPAAQLRQAYHEEIPEKRRPDLATAQNMGYIRRPS